MPDVFCPGEVEEKIAVPASTPTTSKLNLSQNPKGSIIIKVLDQFTILPLETIYERRMPVPTSGRQEVKQKSMLILQEVRGQWLATASRILIP